MISKIDTGDVVAHVVQRRSADPRFAAIGLALADLVSQAYGAVQQPLRRKRQVAKLAVKIVQVIDQRVGLSLGVDVIGAEQLRLDGVKTAIGIGPRVDLRVEL